MLFNFFFGYTPCFYCREMPLTELKSKYRKVSSIEKVNKGWQDEYDASSKQVIYEVLSP